MPHWAGGFCGFQHRDPFMWGVPQKAWQYWLEERRLPARITSHAISVFPLYLWLKLIFIWNKLRKPAGISCIVAFPITRQRYGTYLLFSLQQAYRRILVVWDPSLRDLQQLFPEGRRIFAMKNILFINKKGFQRFLLAPGSFDFVRAIDGPFPPSGADRIFDIDTNLAGPPSADSYLFPYGPHPSNFPRSAAAKAITSSNHERRRPIRVFFSGKLSPSPNHDDLLVELNFGVPGRQTILRELKRSYPDAVWIDDQAKRAHFSRQGYKGDIPLCVSTVKGDPRHWLTELRKADFFLCLPGSHMLMCHNAVEAMSAGCIPILCYENWFSPNLINMFNCLSYRDLDGLNRAIKAALTMTEDKIAVMHQHVIEYYESHLNCVNAAKRIFGSNRHYKRLTVYFNQEDCDNYTAAVSNSVLFTGGSLQSVLDSPNQS
jgi:hypothetical protein